ncbi:dynein light chain roadblock-type 2 isoform X2 [Danio rerio]|uniref:Dynein light chain roadblock-type 2 isoform X2 n=2 Tax=Danio rerio TaxID=7955 RepID=A0AC58IU05_DANRE
MAEVEDTLKRIQAQHGVIGTIVVNGEVSRELRWAGLRLETPGLKRNPTPALLPAFAWVSSGCSGFPYSPKTCGTGELGIPIRTTLDNSTSVQYAGLLHQLTMKARSAVRDIDPQNELTFLRIRSKKHEIMVAPDKEYLLIAIQNPSE